MGFILLCYPVRSSTLNRAELAWYQRLRVLGKHLKYCKKYFQYKSLRSERWFYQISCTSSFSLVLAIYIAVVLYQDIDIIMKSSLHLYQPSWTGNAWMSELKMVLLEFLDSGWILYWPCISLSIGILILFSWQNSSLDSFIYPFKIPHHFIWKQNRI